MMLEASGLHARYGDVAVLEDVSLHVDAGEIVAVVGSNGAGKTTLMRALSGLLNRAYGASATGSIVFDGEDVSRVDSAGRLRRGMSLVPEGRQVWPELSVRDNLVLGGFVRRRERDAARRIDEVVAMFPRLGERLDQDAGTLSGGEQQMLAIGRSLMSSPKLILFDEPSMGLAPVIVDQILDSIVALREAGTTVLIVEQMVNLVLEIADRGYVLERGRVVASGTSAELAADEAVRAAYLGVTSQTVDEDDFEAGLEPEPTSPSA